MKLQTVQDNRKELLVLLDGGAIAHAQFLLGLKPKDVVIELFEDLRIFAPSQEMRRYWADAALAAKLL